MTDLAKKKKGKKKNSDRYFPSLIEILLADEVSNELACQCQIQKQGRLKIRRAYDAICQAQMFYVVPSKYFDELGQEVLRILFICRFKLAHPCLIWQD